MKIEFKGTVEELRDLMSGDNIDTNIAVIPLDEDDYTRFFDESSRVWTGVNELDMLILNHRRKHMYDLLVTRGHLFLNEVLDTLGLPRTKNGQLFGWTYKEGITLDDIYIIYCQYANSSIYLLKFKPQGIIVDEI